MKGQHYDEYALVYERLVTGTAKLGVRGVYRTLLRALEDSVDPAAPGWGNPGYGPLSAFPRAKRDYMALEFAWQQEIDARLSMLASYVLSRNDGNYPGLFNSDIQSAPSAPNMGQLFDFLAQTISSEGLLPNDRTHVFKLAGTYQFRSGLNLGLVGSIASGTPLSQFGGIPPGAPWYGFLVQRGTAGRTPWIWDLSLRTSYVIRTGAAGRWQPRVLLDFLHVASQREPVNFDQVRYFNLHSALQRERSVNFASGPSPFVAIS